MNDIQRGHRAKNILEDELYKESFETVRNQLVLQLESSGMGDKELHNRITIALQVLKQIQHTLTDVMQTGEIAEIELKEKGFLRRVF